jgi:predicted transcriptional regulator
MMMKLAQQDVIEKWRNKMIRIGENEWKTLEAIGKDKVTVGEIVEKTGINIEQLVRKNGILKNLESVGVLKTQKKGRTRTVKLLNSGKYFLDMYKRINGKKK